MSMHQSDEPVIDNAFLYGTFTEGSIRHWELVAGGYASFMPRATSVEVDSYLKHATDLKTVFDQVGSFVERLKEQGLTDPTERSYFAKAIRAYAGDLTRCLGIVRHFLGDLTRYLQANEEVKDKEDQTSLEFSLERGELAELKEILSSFHHEMGNHYQLLFPFAEIIERKGTEAFAQKIFESYESAANRVDLLSLQLRTFNVRHEQGYVYRLLTEAKAHHQVDLTVHGSLDLRFEGVSTSLVLSFLFEGALLNPSKYRKVESEPVKVEVLILEAPSGGGLHEIRIFSETTPYTGGRWDNKQGRAFAPQDTSGFGSGLAYYERTFSKLGLDLSFSAREDMSGNDLVLSKKSL